MAIERQLSHLAQRPHHRRPHRQVRNEVTIHDVDVDDAAASFARGSHLLAQTGKVSRKNRRCEFDQTWALVRKLLVEILTCYGRAYGPNARPARGACYPRPSCLPSPNSRPSFTVSPPYSRGATAISSVDTPPVGLTLFYSPPSSMSEAWWLWPLSLRAPTLHSRLR